MTDRDRPHILVLGAGSIGTRHARNLATAGARLTVSDPDHDRATAAAAQAGPEANALAYDLDAIAAIGFDGAVVASPTSAHADQGEALLASVPKLLVEKPLGLDVASAAGLAAHPDRVAVAYNLRFHEPVQRVAELVATGAVGDVSALRLWFGSWLPDWRPTVDYRATYSARRDLGGGVLLDAIHELDLLVMLCGPGPHQVLGAVVDQLGPLEIDVEDTVKALVRTSSGTTAEISLDYLARRYRRGVEVTGSTATVRVDWARSVIEVEDADGCRQEAATTPVARSYERQDAAFVRWVQGGPPMPVDAADALASVALADEIRRVGSQG